MTDATQMEIGSGAVKTGWITESMGDYLADAAVGSSTIRALNQRDRTPAHVRWDLDNPKPTTDAQFLGAAIHTAILEPDTFAARYVTAGRCEARIKSGDRKGEQCKNDGTRYHSQFGWRCGVRGHCDFDQWDDTKLVLTPDQWTQTVAMQNAVKAHPRAGKIFAAEGPVEQSGYWEDERSGLWLKMRPDKLIPAHGFEVSLKSTKNASPSGWPHEMVRYDYHMSAAHYRDGLTALGADWKRQLIVCVENFPPHLVAVYELTELAIEEGARLNRKWLDVWAECLASGVYPDYDVRIQETTLPESYWRRLEYEDAA